MRTQGLWIAGALAAALLVGCASDEATTDGPQVVARFVGSINPVKGTVEITMVAPDGTPGYTELSGAAFVPAIGGTLPYGTGAGQIFMHTMTMADGAPFGVTFAGPCGPNTLCAFVEGRCNAPAPGFATFTGVTAFIDSTTPVGVTAIGNPFSQGTTNCGAPATMPAFWRFSDPTSADFTFTGHLTGSAM